MKRIYRAINEGLNKSLIDFGDNRDFKKSKTTLCNIKEFHFGDYVYKDLKLGYNSYIGEKVAICVSDEPCKKLYVVLNHPLLNNLFSWANRNTRLYNDKLPEFNNGWENTLYILNNYGNELKGTIWEQLGQNEYIPSMDELKTIYNNSSNTKLWDKIGFTSHLYFSSSLHPGSSPDNGVFVMAFYGAPFSDYKDGVCRSVALLHIK